MNNKKLDQRTLNCTGSFHDYLIGVLQDKEEAETYLKVALDEYHEDGNVAAFKMVLESIVEAQGGQGLLGKNGRHPSLKKLASILSELGFHLSIAPLKLSA